MKFDIKKTFIVGKIVEKGNVNLYTLIDSETFQNLTAIGVKTSEKFVGRELVEAEISVRLLPQRFTLNNGETKYINDASVFINSIKKIGDK